MPHINTQPGQHDSTASAIIVRDDGAEPKVLLHMHKKYPTIMQVGGHVELNETPWQAVLHEIPEETGYDVSQLTVLQPKRRIVSLPSDIVHPQPVVVNTHVVENTDYSHYHTDQIYAFIADSLPNGIPNADESQDLRWFTKSMLEDKAQTQLSANARDVSLFVLAECLAHWEPVALSEFQA